MSELVERAKPHCGRIKGWSKEPCSGGLGFLIVGDFLDHPRFRGQGHTSAVVSFDEAAGTVETRNSRYQLVDRGESTRMPGFPWKGDKMLFLGVNGYEYELEKAKKVFTVGVEYEVADCEVGDWSHSIKFVGIPGQYNGVMFEIVATRTAAGGG